MKAGFLRTDDLRSTHPCLALRSQPAQELWMLSLYPADRRLDKLLAQSQWSSEVAPLIALENRRLQYGRVLRAAKWLRPRFAVNHQNAVHSDRQECGDAVSHGISEDAHPRISTHLNAA